MQRNRRARNGGGGGAGDSGTGGGGKGGSGKGDKGGGGKGGGGKGGGGNIQILGARVLVACPLFSVLMNTLLMQLGADCSGSERTPVAGGD